MTVDDLEREVAGPHQPFRTVSVVHLSDDGAEIAVGEVFFPRRRTPRPSTVTFLCLAMSQAPSRRLGSIFPDVPRCGTDGR